MDFFANMVDVFAAGMDFFADVVYILQKWNLSVYFSGGE
jgi:hypothetical protein